MPFHLLAALGAAVVAPLRRLRPARREAPRPGVHSTAGVISWGAYAGRRYALHGDGMVVSDLDGAPATWRDEETFKVWAAKQPWPST